jgi:hypothetical protein
MTEFTNQILPLKKRWNLLICGPIEHAGYVQARNVEGGLHRKSSFDCTSTIAHNIERWGNLFSTVKLVTWTNQAELIKPELKALNIDIHLIEDPGRESSFCGDSRIRVATSTAAGTRLLLDKDSYTLRIRTDQSFDIGEMLRCHEKNEKKIRRNQRQIKTRLPHISGLCFWLDRPYSLCNYAHASRTKDLLEFAEAQLNYRHASALTQAGWPEGDTIRKHLFSLMDQLQRQGFRGHQCFPAIPKSITESIAEGDNIGIPWHTLKLWRFALRHLYSVASEQTMAGLWWKGELYPHPCVFGNGMRFQKEWRECLKTDCAPIKQYCGKMINNSRQAPWTFRAWYLHGKPSEVAGAAASSCSDLLNRFDHQSSRVQQEYEQHQRL